MEEYFDWEYGCNPDDPPDEGEHLGAGFYLPAISSNERYLAKMAEVEETIMQIVQNPPTGSLLPSCPSIAEIPDNEPIVPRATFDLMVSGKFPLIRIPEGQGWQIKSNVIRTLSQIMTREGLATADLWDDLHAKCGSGATLYVMDQHGERWRVVDVNVDPGGESGELIVQHLGRRSRGGAVRHIDIWDAYGKMIPFVVYKDSRPPQRRRRYPRRFRYR